jgi:hypothetical protein
MIMSENVTLFTNLPSHAIQWKSREDGFCVSNGCELIVLIKNLYKEV